ncbi:MAG: ABC transporter ATP-binding protein [Candidatus Electrothrix aestuarii]|uniref:ABC transporter ATP-binding protein n=1 Tax=Candidatus Electrothrix aestuarii TaxID=3062594 RepID=A0AAU8LUP8_9BACT|nr:ABC transporter ATP-binding protein [Candidatus Electrothrix aestuarii]
MTEVAVELRSVSKVYSSKKAGCVNAVKHVDLEIFQGEFFTILGPSGCGKTTILRMIAGFEKPNNGEVYIQGKKADHLPPHKRPVNTVFQNYALFPNMTVAQNVEYGLKMRKVPSRERKERVAETLQLVRLEGMEGRKPAELSGGQQQRVALARALINRPTVLALDEPLGALDLQLRRQMQHELTQLQQTLAITFVYITHDQEEALAMSDRIAVMNAGQILQVDQPPVIYEHPASRFVANFIGDNNLLPAKVTFCGEKFTQLSIMGELIHLPLQAGKCVVDQQAFLAVRPERMTLALRGKLPPIIEEQGYVFGPNGILTDISIPKRRSRDREGRIVLLNGIVQGVFFVGISTCYSIALGSGDVVIVRVQNTLENEERRYAIDDEVTVWCYMEDMRLLVD